MSSNDTTAFPQLVKFVVNSGVHGTHSSKLWAISIDGAYIAYNHLGHIIFVDDLPVRFIDDKDLKRWQYKLNARLSAIMMNAPADYVHYIG